ncbi:tyrosine-protein phosphatase [uncultured Jatrophihabitans sp.]|uniref:tyrosine-protein phosphatase n=1 Tax=uncultured Jatrophihabitans sp. TaxID=1610747 RepID=UPI0035CA3618
MTALQPLWIELQGADNVRDLGGLPTADGGRTRPGRLIRSDNLQLLSESDVRLLVDVVGVRKVADLRSGVEVASEGPGPMTREPDVEITHLSLLPEAGEHTDAAAAEDDDAPVVLPWQARDAELSEAERRQGASAVYLRYLSERADSIVAALRLIADGDGATIVHCAAGKDRTGTVVALALDLVGVDRDLIAADYALSAERVPRIFARLAQRRTYAGDIDPVADLDRHKPKAETITALFEGLDATYGGTQAWLASQGWTDEDTAAMRASLLG